MSVMVHNTEELALVHLFTGASFADLATVHAAQCAAYAERYREPYRCDDDADSIESVSRHQFNYKRSVIAPDLERFSSIVSLLRYNTDVEDGSEADAALTRIEAATYRATKGGAVFALRYANERLQKYRDAANRRDSVSL